MRKKPRKRQFLLGFLFVVAVLALVRLAFPAIACPHGQNDTAQTAPVAVAEPPATVGERSSDSLHRPSSPSVSRCPHRILGVADYQRCFPDSQAVQIVSAERWGVRPVQNRRDAEERKKDLVYVGESPYYHVDRLSSSIPYLVPRAAVLLHDIGQAFYDSLYVKGVPFNQLIVTSVLRSVDDVARLQQYNTNATERSCHLFGTTFDICYNRYQPVVRPVRDDSLKYVLSEVLRDQRMAGRCYVKYEVKQGCFHITVR